MRRAWHCVSGEFGFTREHNLDVHAAASLAAPGHKRTERYLR
jgi:hypothetical protein